VIRRDVRESQIARIGQSAILGELLIVIVYGGVSSDWGWSSGPNSGKRRPGSAGRDGRFGNLFGMLAIQNRGNYHSARMCVGRPALSASRLMN